MRPMESKRWGVMGAALALFILGCLVGALGMNLYHRRYSANNGWARRAAFQQALKQLNLSVDQQARVAAILADTRSQLRDVRKEESPRVGDIRRKTRERLQSVLTPDQWRQLQEQMKRSESNRIGEHFDPQPEQPLE